MERYPSLMAFCGDEGYRKTAEESAIALGKVLHISARIKDEFAVIPKRWVVERSFAWLNGYRRLAKDFEKNTAISEAMGCVLRTWQYRQHDVGFGYRLMNYLFYPRPPLR
eukprot:gene23287-43766_t